MTFALSFAKFTRKSFNLPERGQMDDILKFREFIAGVLDTYQVYRCAGLTPDEAVEETVITHEARERQPVQADGVPSFASIQRSQDEF